MSNIVIPISLGELIDKITILRIKFEKINSISARKNISLELEKLQMESFSHTNTPLIWK